MRHIPQKIRSLAALASSDPARVFKAFVLLHLALWTLLPAISSPNAPLDVIEGYAWGREWLIGTYKHPPMQAWILEILAQITGRAFWAHFLASQIAVVVAFWAVWQVGRRIMGEAQALVGVLLLEGIIYYNFTSPEFNPNVLQLTFWALASWSFYRGVKDNRLWDWALLGVWAAAGLYTKYSTVLLLGSFAVLVLQRPEARRCLKKPGPYLALLVAALLFLPHVIWLAHNDFMPFTYVKERLQAGGPPTRYVTMPSFFPTFLLSPIVFVVGQILATLPALLLLLMVDEPAQPSATARQPDKFDYAFLTATTFVPMLLTLIMAVGFGFKIHDMWGAPFFNFAGLWAIATFYPEGVVVRLRFVIAWFLIFAVGVLGIATANFLSPYIIGKPLRVLFPGELLAKNIEEEWHKHYTTPLTYAVGDTWPAGNIAYYAEDRPHLFINGETQISPWIDIADVKAKGAVVVWCEKYCSRDDEGHTMNKSKPAFMAKLFPDALVQPTMELPRQTEADVFPVVIGWAIVPPHESAPSH